MRLYVTNTLDDPYVEQTQIAATYAPLARSHRRANQVKTRTPVTVVIGNPPTTNARKEKAAGSRTGARARSLHWSGSARKGMADSNMC